MELKLNLTTLPADFSLVSEHKTQATVLYEGSNPQRHGVLQEIMKATGAAKASVQTGEINPAGTHIELSLSRT